MSTIEKIHRKNIKATFQNADYYIDQYNGHQLLNLDEARDFLERNKSYNEADIVAVHSSLLVSDFHGVYIPQVFISSYDLKDWNIEGHRELECIRRGPHDNEWYWEAWNIIMQDAYFVGDDGHKWTLEQDGDLFCKLYINFNEEN